MIGIYLSGTGNTKHCVEKLVNLLDAAAECIPPEAPHVTETLEKQSTIIPSMWKHITQKEQFTFSRWMGRKSGAIDEAALELYAVQEETT